MRERGGPEDAFGDAEHRGGLMRVPERGRDTGFLGGASPPLTQGMLFPPPLPEPLHLVQISLSPRPQIASVLSDRSALAMA
jgi:hypothetical protein